MRRSLSTASAVVSPRQLAGRIESLIAALDDRNGVRRQKACFDLIAIGEPAALLLADALTSPRRQVRWGAAKALASIASPSATPALTAAMQDEGSGVRWLVAEALIALGREGITAVLERLTEKGDSTRVQEIAHHVLHGAADAELRRIVAPVLAALEGPAPESQGPVAAYAALPAVQAMPPRRPANPKAHVHTSGDTAGAKS
jgi:HEAT repeat protein